MPVNYHQIESRLPEYGKRMKDYETALTQAEQALWEQFTRLDEDVAALRAKIDKAEAQLRRLYCAKPVSEPFLTHRAAPLPPAGYTLIAADGSQIVPNRHRPVQFGVINVGLIQARLGSGNPPEVSIQSTLLDPEELLNPEGNLIGEDEVALYRDFAERRALLEAALAAQAPVIALTDGLLDIYQQYSAPQLNFQADMRKIHQQLEARGVISAGYIDKPGAEMLSRMLDLLRTPEMDLITYDDQKRSLRGISDARLLAKLLKEPGERSAVFETVSKGAAQTSLKVHFFYINISLGSMPYLARVEFPAWLSAQPELVDLLHAVIFQEVQVLDRHPYPYLLHRAHELAVITVQEHEQVETMLLQEYVRQGLQAGLHSNKDANKQLLKI
jgi:uncharacterized coiled-coil protein SlyX